MASRQEDKLDGFSDVNKEEERYYMHLYKKYDAILNDRNQKFEDKVQALMEIWDSLSELQTKEDIRYILQVTDWAKLHVLNVVLTGEWRSIPDSFSNRLVGSISKAQQHLSAINEGLANRCQKLADVVRNPWGDEILNKLISRPDLDIGPQEIEFFCVETAYLVSVRLKKLCENRCEDLALNLVNNFFRYKTIATEQNLNLNATETQLWFIFDIYIALLYKEGNQDSLVGQLEHLSLNDGIELVKRFSKKRVNISKIWRNFNKIAIFGSKFYLSKALMKFTLQLRDILIDLLTTYLKLCLNDNLLAEYCLSVKTLSNLADAEGLCVICEVLHKEVGEKVRPFVIEMYVRAMTTDMNELERLKQAMEEENVKNTTSRLARILTNLSELTDVDVKVAREVILTAFSLEPTKERLTRIEDLARRSGFPVLDTGQEWKCRLHPPALSSDDLVWVCPECGEWMCKPVLTAPLQMNTPLQEALQNSVLGISEALCDDLVVCLSNPRYQLLNWRLSWGDLYRLCILYLNDPEKTKNFVTELKFVDIDYSKFAHIKREPEDEYTGIEKGYEQYLDLDFNPDEDTESGEKTESMSDSNAQKSDPDTLKSLRMFRPNLKRKKDDDPSVDFEPEGLLKKYFENMAEVIAKKNKQENTFSNSSNSFFEVKQKTSNAPSAANSQMAFLSDTKLLSALSATNRITHTSATSESAIPYVEPQTYSSVTDPKNVLAATLPQLGGQVADRPTELIQVQKIKPCQSPEIGKKLRENRLKPRLNDNEHQSPRERRKYPIKLRELTVRLRPLPITETMRPPPPSLNFCHDLPQRSPFILRNLKIQMRESDMIPSTPKFTEQMRKASEREARRLSDLFLSSTLPYDKTEIAEITRQLRMKVAVEVPQMNLAREESTSSDAPGCRSIHQDPPSVSLSPKQTASVKDEIPSETQFFKLLFDSPVQPSPVCIKEELLVPNLLNLSPPQTEIDSYLRASINQLPSMIGKQDSCIKLSPSDTNFSVTVTDLPDSLRPECLHQPMEPAEFWTLNDLETKSISSTRIPTPQDRQPISTPRMTDKTECDVGEILDVHKKTDLYSIDTAPTDQQAATSDKGDICGLEMANNSISASDSSTSNVDTNCDNGSNKVLAMIEGCVAQLVNEISKSKKTETSVESMMENLHQDSGSVIIEQNTSKLSKEELEQYLETHADSAGSVSSCLAESDSVSLSLDESDNEAFNLPEGVRPVDDDDLRLVRRKMQNGTQLVKQDSPDYVSDTSEEGGEENSKCRNYESYLMKLLDNMRDSSSEDKDSTPVSSSNADTSSFSLSPQSEDSESDSPPTTVSNESSVISEEVECDSRASDKSDDTLCEYSQRSEPDNSRNLKIEEGDPIPCKFSEFFDAQQQSQLASDESFCHNLIKEEKANNSDDQASGVVDADTSTSRETVSLQNADPRETNDDSRHEYIPQQIPDTDSKSRQNLEFEDPRVSDGEDGQNKNSHESENHFRQSLITPPLSDEDSRSRSCDLKPKTECEDPQESDNDFKQILGPQHTSDEESRSRIDPRKGFKFEDPCRQSNRERNDSETRQCPEIEDPCESYVNLEQSDTRLSSDYGQSSGDPYEAYLRLLCSLFEDSFRSREGNSESRKSSKSEDLRESEFDHLDGSLPPFNKDCKQNVSDSKQSSESEVVRESISNLELNDTILSSSNEDFRSWIGGSVSRQRSESEDLRESENSHTLVSYIGEVLFDNDFKQSLYPQQPSDEECNLRQNRESDDLHHSCSNSRQSLGPQQSADQDSDLRQNKEYEDPSDNDSRHSLSPQQLSDRESDPKQNQESDDSHRSGRSSRQSVGSQQSADENPDLRQKEQYEDPSDNDSRQSVSPQQLSDKESDLNQNQESDGSHGSGKSSRQSVSPQQSADEDTDVGQNKQNEDPSDNDSGQSSSPQQLSDKGSDLEQNQESDGSHGSDRSVSPQQLSDKESDLKQNKESDGSHGSGRSSRQSVSPQQSADEDTDLRQNKQKEDPSDNDSRQSSSPQKLSDKESDLKHKQESDDSHGSGRSSRQCVGSQQSADEDTDLRQNKQYEDPSDNDSRQSSSPQQLSDKESDLEQNQESDGSHGSDRSVSPQQLSDKESDPKQNQESDHSHGSGRSSRQSVSPQQLSDKESDLEQNQESDGSHGSGRSSRQSVGPQQLSDKESDLKQNQESDHSHGSGRSSRQSVSPQQSADEDTDSRQNKQKEDPSDNDSRQSSSPQKLSDKESDLEQNQESDGSHGSGRSSRQSVSPQQLSDKESDLEQNQESDGSHGSGRSSRQSVSPQQLSDKESDLEQNQESDGSHGSDRSVSPQQLSDKESDLEQNQESDDSHGSGRSSRQSVSPQQLSDKESDLNQNQESDGSHGSGKSSRQSVSPQQSADEDTDVGQNKQNEDPSDNDSGQSSSPQQLSDKESDLKQNQKSDDSHGSGRSSRQSVSPQQLSDKESDLEQNQESDGSHGSGRSSRQSVSPQQLYDKESDLEQNQESDGSHGSDRSVSPQQLSDKESDLKQNQESDHSHGSGRSSRQSVSPQQLSDKESDLEQNQESDGSHGSGRSSRQSVSPQQLYDKESDLEQNQESDGSHGSGRSSRQSVSPQQSADEDTDLRQNKQKEDPSDNDSRQSSSPQQLSDKESDLKQNQKSDDSHGSGRSSRQSVSPQQLYDKESDLEQNQESDGSHGSDRSVSPQQLSDKESDLKQNQESDGSHGSGRSSRQSVSPQQLSDKESDLEQNQESDGSHGSDRSVSPQQLSDKESDPKQNQESDHSHGSGRSSRQSVSPQQLSDKESDLEQNQESDGSHGSGRSSRQSVGPQQLSDKESDLKQNQESDHSHGSGRSSRQSVSPQQLSDKESDLEQNQESDGSHGSGRSSRQSVSPQQSADEDTDLRQNKQKEDPSDNDSRQSSSPQKLSDKESDLEQIQESDGSHGSGRSSRQSVSPQQLCDKESDLEQNQESDDSHRSDRSVSPQQLSDKESDLKQNEESDHSHGSGRSSRQSVSPQQLSDKESDLNQNEESDHSHGSGRSSRQSVIAQQSADEETDLRQNKQYEDPSDNDSRQSSSPQQLSDKESDLKQNQESDGSHGSGRSSRQSVSPQQPSDKESDLKQNQESDGSHGSGRSSRQSVGSQQSADEDTDLRQNKQYEDPSDNDSRQSSSPQQLSDKESDLKQNQKSDDSHGSGRSSRQSVSPQQLSDKESDLKHNQESDDSHGSGRSSRQSVGSQQLSDKESDLKQNQESDGSHGSGRSSRQSVSPQQSADEDTDLRQNKQKEDPSDNDSRQSSSPQKLSDKESDLEHNQESDDSHGSGRSSRQSVGSQQSADEDTDLRQNKQYEDPSDNDSRQSSSPQQLSDKESDLKQNQKSDDSHGSGRSSRQSVSPQQSADEDTDLRQNKQYEDPSDNDSRQSSSPQQLSDKESDLEQNQESDDSHRSGRSSRQSVSPQQLSDKESDLEQNQESDDSHRSGRSSRQSVIAQQSADEETDLRQNKQKEDPSDNDSRQSSSPQQLSDKESDLKQNQESDDSHRSGRSSRQSLSPHQSDGDSDFRKNKEYEDPADDVSERSLSPQQPADKESHSRQNREAGDSHDSGSNSRQSLGPQQSADEDSDSSEDKEYEDPSDNFSERSRSPLQPLDLRQNQESDDSHKSGSRFRQSVSPQQSTDEHSDLRQNKEYGDPPGNESAQSLSPPVKKSKIGQIQDSDGSHDKSSKSRQGPILQRSGESPSPSPQQPSYKESEPRQNQKFNDSYESGSSSRQNLSPQQSAYEDSDLKQNIECEDLSDNGSKSRENQEFDDSHDNGSNSRQSPSPQQPANKESDLRQNRESDDSHESGKSSRQSVSPQQSADEVSDLRHNKEYEDPSDNDSEENLYPQQLLSVEESNLRKNRESDDFRDGGSNSRQSFGGQHSAGKDSGDNEEYEDPSDKVFERWFQQPLDLRQNRELDDSHDSGCSSRQNLSPQQSANEDSDLRQNQEYEDPFDNDFEQNLSRQELSVKESNLRQKDINDFHDNISNSRQSLDPEQPADEASDLGQNKEYEDPSDKEPQPTQNQESDDFHDNSNSRQSPSSQQSSDEDCDNNKKNEGPSDNDYKQSLGPQQPADEDFELEQNKEFKDPIKSVDDSRQSLHPQQPSDKNSESRQNEEFEDPSESNENSRLSLGPHDTTEKDPRSRQSETSYLSENFLSLGRENKFEKNEVSSNISGSSSEWETISEQTVTSSNSEIDCVNPGAMNWESSGKSKNIIAMGESKIVNKTNDNSPSAESNSSYSEFTYEDSSSDETGHSIKEPYVRKVVTDSAVGNIERSEHPQVIDIVEDVVTSTTNDQLQSSPSDSYSSISIIITESSSSESESRVSSGELGSRSDQSESPSLSEKSVENISGHDVELCPANANESSSDGEEDSNTSSSQEDSNTSSSQDSNSEENPEVLGSREDQQENIEQTNDYNCENNPEVPGSNKDNRENTQQTNESKDQYANVKRWRRFVNDEKIEQTNDNISKDNPEVPGSNKDNQENTQQTNESKDLYANVKRWRRFVIDEEIEQTNENISMENTQQTNESKDLYADVRRRRRFVYDEKIEQTNDNISKDNPEVYGSSKKNQDLYADDEYRMAKRMRNVNNVKKSRPPTNEYKKSHDTGVYMDAMDLVRDYVENKCPTAKNQALMAPPDMTVPTARNPVLRADPDMTVTIEKRSSGFKPTYIGVSGSSNSRTETQPSDIKIINNKKSKKKGLTVCTKPLETDIVVIDTDSEPDDIVNLISDDEVIELDESSDDALSVSSVDSLVVNLDSDEELDMETLDSPSKESPDNRVQLPIAGKSKTLDTTSKCITVDHGSDERLTISSGSSLEVQVGSDIEFSDDETDDDSKEKKKYDDDSDGRGGSDAHNRENSAGGKDKKNKDPPNDDSGPSPKKHKGDSSSGGVNDSFEKITEGSIKCNVHSQKDHDYTKYIAVGQKPSKQKGKFDDLFEGLADIGMELEVSSKITSKDEDVDTIAADLEKLIRSDDVKSTEATECERTQDQRTKVTDKKPSKDVRRITLEHSYLSDENRLFVDMDVENRLFTDLEVEKENRFSNSEYSTVQTHGPPKRMYFNRKRRLENGEDKNKPNKRRADDRNNPIENDRRALPLLDNIQNQENITSAPQKVKKEADRKPINNVPGLRDYSQMRPRRVSYVVNVVQRTIQTRPPVSNANPQTSTQVTPHIQRVGQPKLPERKPEFDEQTNSSTIVTLPSTSQTSTLVRMLNAAKPKTMTKLMVTTSPNSTTQQNVDVQTSKTTTGLKLVSTTTQAGTTTTSPTAGQGGTILQFICKSSSLPKFQQAFGKTVYQAPANETTVETPATSVAPATDVTTANAADNKKVPPKAIPVNVQPITGNVIFRGQVPVGQTVSLIPPGSNTRQLFRITGSTPEQISLVKETVIQNKMSALLAAALQAKPKITDQNGEVVEEYAATRITLCRPGSVPPNATRIVKPVQLQIPAVIRAPQPNVSSTTLEQLREFDLVYKQVKERSNNTQPETSACTTQEAPPQNRIAFTYVNQVQKYPVVVVSSYSPIQQPPTISVTSSQSPTSGPQVTTVVVPKVAVKVATSSKGKTLKGAVTKTSPSTSAAAVANIPKPQQKPQEDEGTTQRIFDILAEYAEQLRNSPDLNNKPAPRRRSNPPTNPNSNCSASSSKKKKKKSTSSNTSNMVETDNEDLTMGSEDSSGGNVVHLSMTDEEQSQSASSTPPETNIEPATTTTAPRSLIVTDGNNQRNVIIADSSVGDALKMPNTAVIMPGNYIMPVSLVKGGQQIAVVSGGNKILTTLPARSGQNMLVLQSFVNKNNKGGIVKYSTLHPLSGVQNIAAVPAPVVLPSNSVATVALGQPITLKKLSDDNNVNNTELLLTIAPRELKMEKSPDLPQPDSTNPNCDNDIKIDVDCSEVLNNIQKTNSVATSVIASIKKDDDVDGNCARNDTAKQNERIGSVLVNASSNGPMLSHTNARYRKPMDGVASTTFTVNHNIGKVAQPTKIFKNNAVYYAIRTKKPINKKMDSEMQKQAVIEREMHLQKTLSEECEDLGVDEPSTSDLFPEADLLFDSNHSPSFDQAGQKIQNDSKKESMHLFSDDEGSGPLRSDFFDYVEYPINVGRINGNNDTTSMSEVTLNSPMSPDFTISANKYKYKYSNRKRGERNKQQADWQAEVSSSEDAMEIVRESDSIPIAIQEETVIDEAITEVDMMQCSEPSHNAMRRRMASKSSVIMPCSCINGKTPKRRSTSPKNNPNKKIMLSKKR